MEQDAFILWQSALRNTNTIVGMNGAPGLVDLLPLAVQQLSTNLELLGTIVRIHESYFLLDAPRVLQVSETMFDPSSSMLRLTSLW